MANEFIEYTRKGDTRYLAGEPATVEECNAAYILGNVAETYYCKRARKNVTIRGRSIMREEDSVETVIDAFSGMEEL